MTKKKTIALGLLVLVSGLVRAQSSTAREAAKKEDIEAPRAGKGDINWLDTNIISELKGGIFEHVGSRQPLILATFAEQEMDLARVQLMIESLRAFGGRF